jgi:hypothetical protein
MIENVIAHEEETPVWSLALAKDIVKYDSSFIQESGYYFIHFILIRMDL